MAATARETVFRTSDPAVRVRWRRSEAPPPYTYAVTVEVREEDFWTTVRLWDNADDVHEHHVHGYTQQEGKQKPMIRQVNSVNEAMAMAIAEARGNFTEIVRQWRQS